MNKRTCNGCTACCFTHSVEEIQKSKYTKCEKCSATGCSIYQYKPRACSTFECAWLTGVIPGEGERPDKLGAVAHVERRDVGDKAFAILVLKPFGVHTVEQKRKIKREIYKQIRIGVIVYLGVDPNSTERTEPIVYLNKRIFESQEEQDELLRRIGGPFGKVVVK